MMTGLPRDERKEGLEEEWEAVGLPELVAGITGEIQPLLELPQNLERGRNPPRFSARILSSKQN